MTRAKKLSLIGLAAAIFVAGSAWLFGYHGHVGGDGPDALGWIGLALFFPAIWLSEGLASRVSMGHVASLENTLFLVLAFLQYFIMFWFLHWLVSKLGRHNQPIQPTPR